MEAPLALYRRYRPETFAEVIGQDHVTAPLRNALSNNRVNHAYLFSGPRGCGKTTSARILARAINCEKGPIAEPCGVCKSCTDLARGGPGSIDVIEIDAASHGGVDDARDLRERAFFAPVESRYKIYIIDEAHMVTTQGFNALLKLVEEPPPHLKFIFATTEPDKVIGTIRSRTHHYPFRLVPPKVLADYMATLCESEGVAIEPAALPLVVRAGAGSVRDSLSVLDQLIGGAGPAGVTYELAVALLGFTPDSLLDACVDGFAAHDSAAVFETVEKVIETGQDPKRFAEDLLRRLRDLVVLSAVPTAVTSGLIEAAEDQAERLQTQAAGIGPAELTRAADIVAAGLLEMRGATAPRLQLELICAKVLLPGADDSTNGIQARLDRMERRLAIPSGTSDSVTGAVQGAGTPGPGQTGGMSAPARAGGVSGPVQAAGVSGVAGADSYGDGSAPAAAATSRAAARAAAGAGNRPGSSPDDTASAAPTAGSSAPAASVETAGPASSAASAGPGRTAAGVSGTGDRAGQGSESAAGGPVGASGGARTGAWGDEPAGAPEQPGQSAQPSEPAQSAPAGQGASASGQAGVAAGGGVGLADIRRLWPEVLEAVKAQRRFAWIMLSQNAQVIAIDDQTLTLGLVNAGARESFARSGSDEILRQAMIDSIGVNRRVEAVVDPSADPGAGGGGSAGRPGPQSGGPGQAGGPQSGGAAGLGGSGGPGWADGSGSGGPGGGVSAGVPGAVGGPGASGLGGPSAGGPAAAGAPGAGDPGTGVSGAGGAGAGAGGSDAAGLGSGAGGHGGAPDAGGSGAASGVGGAAGQAAGSAAGGGGHDVGGGSAAGAAGPSAGGGGAADAAGAGARSGGTAGSAGADAGGSGAAGSGGRGAASSAGHGAGGGGAAGSAGAGAGGSGAAGSAGAGAGGGGAAGSGGRGAGGGAAGAGAAGSGARGVGGRTGAWDDGPGAAIALQEPPDEYDIPPEDPWEDGPIARQQPAAQAAQAGRRQTGSKRRAAEAAVAAEQARQASAAAAAPDVPLTPEEEADAIGEDDMVLEEDSRSHTDLLRETLGAQIITEEPN